MVTESYSPGFRLEDIPFVVIEVTHPHGHPSTWTDAALIAFLDEFEAKVEATRGEIIQFDKDLLWLDAWTELHKRTS